MAGYLDFISVKTWITILTGFMNKINIKIQPDKSGSA